VVTVNPKPITTTASTAKICSDVQLNIPLTATATSTFTWTLGTMTGSISNASANSTPSVLLNQTLTNLSNSSPASLVYKVVPTSSVSLGACKGDTAFITITVNPTPKLQGVLRDTICSEDTFMFTPVSSVPGAGNTKFFWSRPS